MKKTHGKFVVSSMGAALVASALTPAVSVSGGAIRFRILLLIIPIMMSLTSWQMPVLLMVMKMEPSV